ncbi:ABC transporter permease [Edaphobacter sp. HDX4]|uniref:ABC transporter permease n=1 Tax=Edaphobacter sp. HDX4 TaxID=2794064 RepID=UPI002FE51042
MSNFFLLSKSAFIGWRCLKRNRLRTILTITGMTIGVATVLTMIALGKGAQSAIQDQVRAAGMNVIVVTAGNFKAKQQWTSAGESEEPGSLADGEPAMAAYVPGSDGTRLRYADWEPRRPVRLLRVWQPSNNPLNHLARSGENAAGRGASDKLSLEDADAIARLTGVQAVSPGVADNITLKRGGKTWFTRLHGEGSDLPMIRRAWVFKKGRNFNKAETDGAEKIAVLGSVVAQKLFADANPVGEHLTIHGEDFRIIGLVGSGSWMVPSGEGDDQFDVVYIPVTTGKELLKKIGLGTVTISTVSTGDVAGVTKAVRNLLRQRHGLTYREPDDFVVASQAKKTLAKGGMRTDVARAISSNVTNLDQVTLEQLGKTLDRASRTMTALLASIASVSLIVGGIGIMNVTLLSVTERTKEIGIRRAVGARSDEVMLQFLMEAVTLSLFGGGLGVLLGLLISELITRMVAWSTNVSALAIALSFGISAGIGILFGYYPARQASRVTPMTSLGYE